MLPLLKGSDILNTMKNKYISHAITAFISSITTAALLSIVVLVNIIMPFQKEAVDKGFAVWEVTNNATGQTKFQWVDYSAAEALAQNEKPLK